MRVDPSIEALFGRDRSRVMGVLANSSAPLSSYAISKLSGAQRIKVSRELRRLEAASIVRSLGSGAGRKGWTLTDAGLRRFFSERVRIVSAADLEGRSKPSPSAKRAAVRWAEGVVFSPSKNLSKVDFREFRRPPSKDRELRRAGLRVSRRRK